MPRLAHAALPALACLVFVLPAAAQSLPDGDLLLTRAERTDFRETTRYDEVMDLVRRVADLSPDIHLTTFGYTTEGRPLPLVVVGAPDASAAAVRATAKTRVYLQGDIHAGEVCGKEALLMLLRRFASGGYPAWADSLVLLVAPIYNADGNERIRLDNRPRQNGPVGGMGQRANAQGLDLNRDHMKLDAPEARSLARLLTEYDPQVAVDLHTTNGSHHGYHLTYAPPLHPNTPQGLDGFLRSTWLPRVTQRIQAKHGWAYGYYGIPRPDPDGDLGWFTYDARPRYNTNYVGVRNRFGILSEAYAYASFEDRVRATLWFVEEILDFAEQNAGRIRQLVEAADRESIVGRNLTVRARYRKGPEVTIPMGAVDTLRHPLTGALVFQRRDVTTPTPMGDYGSFEAAETATAPEGYWVLPEAADAIDRLEAHGITVVRFASEREVQAQRFVMDSTRVASREYQGHHERTVWGRWEDTRLSLPAGTAWVSVDQPLGRLAFMLLEPRSDDGLTAWGILDEGIEAGAFPVLRRPPGG